MLPSCPVLLGGASLPKKTRFVDKRGRAAAKLTGKNDDPRWQHGPERRDEHSSAAASSHFEPPVLVLPTDGVVWYHTLVQDGAQRRFQTGFPAMAQLITPSAERKDNPSQTYHDGKEGTPCSKVNVSEHGFVQSKPTWTVTSPMENPLDVSCTQSQSARVLRLRSVLGTSRHEPNIRHVDESIS